MTWQSFSDQLIKLWDGWEIRVLVLLSLFVQIVLIIFGSQRKYKRRICINILVWMAYLVADMVATVALGFLARSGRDFEANKSLKLQAFWAPFLLLHLGGPDTITAYSLKDNELWLRHALNFLFQVGVAFYVFIPTWRNKDAFRFIAIPLFMAGITKYGERILVLYSSSSKQFKESLSPTPGFSQDVEDRKEGSDEMKSAGPSNVEDGKERSDEMKSADPSKLEYRKEGNEKKSTDNYLTEAVFLFKKFRCLYADLILDHAERKKSYSLLEKKSAKEAFKLVSVELGFMYDVLYTKTLTIYSKLGIILRCIWLFSHIFVSVFFLIIIDKSSYSPSDISITYVLLFGAIFLEFYAFIVLLFSDWTKYWLTEHSKCGTDLLSKDSRRWSGRMGQYNLLRVPLSEHGQYEAEKCLMRFGIKELVDKIRYLTWKKVDNNGLLEKIFDQLREKGRGIDANPSNNQKLKDIIGGRGDYVLRKRNCHKEFCESTTEVEFDYSLLLWHIATDLCYYDDLRRLKAHDEVPPEWEISKRLSDYMLYLLIICPTMLPKGIGEIRYRDTCLDAMRFFRYKKFDLSTDIEAACKAILEEFDKNNRNGSLSVLLNGCELAKKLQEFNNDGNRNFKWEMISEVWIEMFGYAASHCGWKEHGEQLRNGGELLSHVCLLMAHLGLSDQYQLQHESISPDWTTKLFIALQDSYKLIFLIIFVVIIVIPETIVLLVLGFAVAIITCSSSKAGMITQSWGEKINSAIGRACVKIKTRLRSVRQ